MHIQLGTRQKHKTAGLLIYKENKSSSSFEWRSTVSSTVPTGAPPPFSRFISRTAIEITNEPNKHYK